MGFRTLIVTGPDSGGRVRIAAFAYEEAEDMWVEANHIRQQYVSAREAEEQEQESKQATHTPTGAKADTAPAGETEPIEATATARRQAEELGVNLEEVQGTGKGGKITTLDVKKKAQQTQL